MTYFCHKDMNIRPKKLELVEIFWMLNDKICS